MLNIFGKNNKDTPSALIPVQSSTTQDKPVSNSVNNSVQQPVQVKSSQSNMASTSNVLNSSNSLPAASQSNDSLPPPKTLPDLAQDMFGGLYNPTFTKTSNDMSTTPESNTIINRVVAPPSKSEVPKLDLNLIKDHKQNTSGYDISQITENKPIETKPFIDPALIEKQNQEYAEYLRRSALLNSFNMQNQHYGVPTQASQKYYSLRPEELNRIIGSGSGTFFSGLRAELLSKGLNQTTLQEILSSNIMGRLSSFHNNITKNNDLTSLDVLALLQELDQLELLWLKQKEMELSWQRASAGIEAEIVRKVDFLRGGNSNLGNTAAYTTGNNTAGTNTSVQLNAVTSSEPISFKDGLDRKKPGFPLFNLLKKSEDKVDSNIQYSPNILSNAVQVSTENLTDTEKFFYAANGAVFKSLKDLLPALINMSDDIYYLHVNSSKNDFANWTEGVFGFKTLANSLRSCKNRKEMIDLLLSNNFGV